MWDKSTIIGGMIGGPVGAIFGSGIGHHKRVGDNKDFLQQLQCNPQMQSFVAQNYGPDTLQMLLSNNPDQLANAADGNAVNQIRDKWDDSPQKKFANSSMIRW
jgi:hypothetical protein